MSHRWRVLIFIVLLPLALFVLASVVSQLVPDT
jgi:hypothetical protein